jgi:hypothetical protein
MCLTNFGYFGYGLACGTQNYLSCGPTGTYSYYHALCSFALSFVSPNEPILFIIVTDFIDKIAKIH